MIASYIQNWKSVLFCDDLFAVRIVCFLKDHLGTTDGHKDSWDKSRFQFQH